LLGLLDDKQYKPIVRLLQKHFNQIIITEPVHERALPALVLQREFQKYNKQPQIERSIIKSYHSVKEILKKTDYLFVMGSHFIVGEILRDQQKALDTLK
jgi:folylpolyglutamate synthase/dihydropteroate synthase